MDWQAHWRRGLSQRREQALYRERRSLGGPQGPRILVDGRSCLNFSSNDYLGLAGHPEVVAALAEAASRWGVGSGASHLVCGHSAEHQALEGELAAFTGRQRALLFSTGYMANLGTVCALIGRGDRLFQDKLNHASLLDAGQLCGARMQRFLHSDVAQLQRRLEGAGPGRKMIAVDGVYSMDGDCAPLSDLSRLAADHDALLMVDDAHGFGVLGADGRGSAEHWGLGEEALPVLMGTLGKSLGTFGAFVAGSEALIETLIQRARTYIYTTALPPAVAAATRVSLRLLREEGWRRAHLAVLRERLQAGLRALPWPVSASITPIQPILIGSPELALDLSRRLLEAGFYVPAIRPPTVPVGTARLRVTLSAAHSVEDVDRLLGALARQCP